MKFSVIACLFISLVSTAKLHAIEAIDPEELWDIGAGLRLNYLRLTGGFSGYDASTGNTFDLNYKDIGMSTWAPSLALALGGKYKKWNLFFGASRGSYTGSFITKQDITIKDELIPAGSQVDGKITMGIYSLSTTFAFVKKPEHDVGVGLGFLILDMSTEFKTTDVSLGDTGIYPMPFLALSGRKKFGKWRLSAVGGGAHFDGKQDGLDYTIFYYTFDAQVGYEFYKKGNYIAVTNLGYRLLRMNMKGTQDNGNWFEEDDHYNGPFLSVLVRYTAFAK